MTIGERIRLVRKKTGLNQTDFGEKVGLRQSSLGQIESSVRNATDRTILLICEKYNVREEWLRNGIEPMFSKSDDEQVNELAQKYNLTPLQADIIKTVLKYPDAQRDPIVNFIVAVTESLGGRKAEIAEETSPEIASIRELSPVIAKESKEDIERQADEFAEIARKQFILEKKRELQASSVKESDAV